MPRAFSRWVQLRRAAQRRRHHHPPHGREGGARSPDRGHDRRRDRAKVQTDLGAGRRVLGERPARRRRVSCPTGYAASAERASRLAARRPLVFALPRARADFEGARRREPKLRRESVKAGLSLACDLAGPAHRRHGTRLRVPQPRAGEASGGARSGWRSVIRAAHLGSARGAISSALEARVGGRPATSWRRSAQPDEQPGAALGTGTRRV
jgi:hypothetical protein